MSEVRLSKDLKKKCSIEYKKNDKGEHRNLSDHFEADFPLYPIIFNRLGPLVFPPGHQHVLAVP